MTPTSRAKRNRKKKVASKITMEMIRHALLRHVVVHGPTTWLQTNKGLKVNQFLKNLMGTDHGATVDVWAARLMRRLGYEGLQERHRILPMNETKISDADFKFSQEVFAEAAKRMGITPDALQGGMWFAEKSLWNDKGWSPLDLGDYRKEIKKGGMIRQRVGLRLEEQKDKGKEGPPPGQKSLL